MIAMIAERAAQAPAGQWVQIQTTMGWNESNLAESRLPTAAELGRASDAHPVLVPRGSTRCSKFGGSPPAKPKTPVPKAPTSDRRRDRLELHTHAGARPCGEATRLGALEPGMLADLVACPRDPGRGARRR
jgi:predicted amidohydrolase YtcJ